MIEKPKSGNWSLQPSSEGWKLVKESLLLPSTNSRLHLMDKSGNNESSQECVGGISLIPALPKHAGVRLIDTSDKYMLFKIIEAVNSSIVELALAGQALANVRVIGHDAGSVTIQLTSTDPLGIDKTIDSNAPSGIIQ